MNVSEFSEQFDVLYNNISSNAAPGLDEYEKSVFLTKAQDEVVRKYFSRKENKVYEGFDDSGQRQINFQSLVTTNVQSPATISNPQWFIDNRTNGVASISLSFYGNILCILNEQVVVTRGTTSKVLQVVPLSYEQYQLQMNKPFKRPNKTQAWRIEAFNMNSQIIAQYGDTIDQYRIRYVKRPAPIILVDLTDTSIEGYTSAQTCSLDESLHQEILQRAVELAKATYTADLSTQVQLGTISQTNIGNTQR